VFVYKIEATLRESNKPLVYKITTFMRDPTDISTFHGSIAIKESQITYPANITAKITVEDLVGHQVEYEYTKSTTTTTTTTSISTNGLGFLIPLISFSFIWIIGHKRKRR